MNRRELLATTGAVLAGSAAGAASIPTMARTLDDLEGTVYDPEYNPTLSDGVRETLQEDDDDVADQLVGTAAAEHAKKQPDHVHISYDEAIIKEYRPSLVLEGVDPRPLALHAMHAESDKSDLNAVYFFAKYSYQEGNAGRSDSHLGDHEPIIVWYESTNGDVVRVDGAAYHWFRGTWLPEELAFADELEHRPVFRVDPRYHHYYAYSGSLPGADVALENLLESMPRWLENGLESELARSQPYDPWQMLSRSDWWKHNTGNWVDASLKAAWFNLGFSDAAETSDLEEAESW